ncbi:hypothetical protein F9278_44255 [Streptomyces phaeolivaceus]|uniref:RICIN domain-containing protein n=1 Tax=Streptomyces phaeolivaceus TaxID=2653200 RepID=A0A5P8KG95_9ACTN|nr:hypothetical protein [Streptomyces phaeolivaceus]QFR02031.1 hypothetical protein F9278_44255 [Streptomyces phaeolivaceus]
MSSRPAAGSATAGQRVGQWVDDSATGTWKVVEAGNGHVKLQSAKNKDLYPTGASTDAPLTLRPATSDGSQDWKLVP